MLRSQQDTQFRHDEALRQQNEMLGSQQKTQDEHSETLQTLSEILVNQQKTLESQQKTQDEHSEMIRAHGEMQRNHTATLAALQTIFSQQADILSDQKVLMTRLDENQKEIRRDARHTQRIWTRLAQKNGWLDDEDLWDDQDAAP